MNNSADICKFVWYLYEKGLWPWWSQSWNLIKLKIPVTRKEFELQMYVGTSSSKVLEFGTVGQESHLVEIFQLGDLSLTLMPSCPRFTKDTQKWHWQYESLNCRPLTCLTLSWRRSLSYRNQFIDLQNKSMDWFLYDIGLRHERGKSNYLLLNE